MSEGELSCTRRPQAVGEGETRGSRWFVIRDMWFCEIHMTPADSPRIGWFILAALAMSLTACTSLLKRDDYAVYHTPPEGLRAIETVHLQELSRSKPVSVGRSCDWRTERFLRKNCVSCLNQKWVK